MSGSSSGRDGLPSELAAALDGTGLRSKVGATFLMLVSGLDGWPHVAMLSAGEVYAPTRYRVVLALHSDSATARALGATGRGLLLTIVDRKVCRTRVATTLLGPWSSNSGITFFAGDVEQVAVDAVDYAEVVHGIAYKLPDPERVVARWEATVAAMRELP